MLFPLKIKRYLIYKNVDFALFISIRKIILTTNNAINYTGGGGGVPPYMKFT